MTRNRGVFGVHMGTWKNEAVMVKQLQRIMQGVLEGSLKPVIDSVFDVEDIAKSSPTHSRWEKYWKGFASI